MFARAIAAFDHIIDCSSAVIASDFSRPSGIVASSSLASCRCRVRTSSWASRLTGVSGRVEREAALEIVAADHSGVAALRAAISSALRKCPPSTRSFFVSVVDAGSRVSGSSVSSAE
jgi:hypothetical protein